MQFCLPVTVKCVLSYALLFVLTPPAHVEVGKDLLGEEWLLWVPDAERPERPGGRHTRLGQERETRKPEAKLLVSVLSRHRHCLSNDTQMGSEKQACVLKWLHVHSEEQCYLRCLILKMGVSKQGWGEQGVWVSPQGRGSARVTSWAAPPAELESEPKPPSRGTSPDHQLPHFTPGFSANL